MVSSVGSQQSDTESRQGSVYMGQIGGAEGGVHAGGGVGYQYNVHEFESQPLQPVSAYGPATTYGSSQFQTAQVYGGGMPEYAPHQQQQQPLSAYGGSQPPFPYRSSQFQPVYGGSPNLAPALPRRVHHLAPLSNPPVQEGLYPSQNSGFLPGMGMIL